MAYTGKLVEGDFDSGTTDKIEDQRERILSLFRDDVKQLVRHKHISSESMMFGGKEVHVIYIADDESIKDYYKRQIR